MLDNTVIIVSVILLVLLIIILIVRDCIIYKTFPKDLGGIIMKLMWPAAQIVSGFTLSITTLLKICAESMFRNMDIISKNLPTIQKIATRCDYGTYSTMILVGGIAAIIYGVSDIFRVFNESSINYQLSSSV